MDDSGVEHKSYRHLFFLGIVFLSLMSFWAFVEETYSRRPWKHYQKAFYDQQHTKARLQLQKSRAALESNDEYERLLDEIERVKVEFNRPEIQRDYRTASRDLKRAEVELFEIAQEFSFSKAEEDEAFYKWKHTLRRQPEADDLKRRWETLTKQTASLLLEVEELQKKKDEAEKSLGRFTSDIDRLEAQKEDMET